MFDNFITKNKESEGGKVGSEKDDKVNSHIFYTYAHVCACMRIELTEV